MREASNPGPPTSLFRREPRRNRSQSQDIAEQSESDVPLLVRPPPSEELLDAFKRTPGIPHRRRMRRRVVHSDDDAALVAEPEAHAVETNGSVRMEGVDLPEVSRRLLVGGILGETPCSIPDRSDHRAVLPPSIPASTVPASSLAVGRSVLVQPHAGHEEAATARVSEDDVDLVEPSAHPSERPPGPEGE